MDEDQLTDFEESTDNHPVCAQCGEALTYITNLDLYTCDNGHVNIPELVSVGEVEQ